MATEYTEDEYSLTLQALVAFRNKLRSDRQVTYHAATAERLRQKQLRVGALIDKIRDEQVARRARVDNETIIATVDDAKAYIADVGERIDLGEVMKSTLGLTDEMLRPREQYP